MIWTSFLHPLEPCRYASNSSHNDFGSHSNFAPLRFHGEGKSNRSPLREYQSFHPSDVYSWPNTQCASQGVHLPMAMASSAPLPWLVSTRRNLTGLVCIHPHPPARQLATDSSFGGLTDRKQRKY